MGWDVKTNADESGKVLIAILFVLFVVACFATAGRAVRYR
jgi:hypothetical protein